MVAETVARRLDGKLREMLEGALPKLKARAERYSTQGVEAEETKAVEADTEVVTN